MKKVWVAPVLETYGTVVELTQAKEYGIGDTMLITPDGCIPIKYAESCTTCGG